MIKLDIHTELKHIDNSITHKKIMSSKSGSIAAFAMGDVETIAEHKTRHDEYIYILDGQIELIVNNKPIVMNKGGLYCIGANNEHTVNGQDKGKFVLVVLKNPKGAENEK